MVLTLLLVRVSTTVLSLLTRTATLGKNPKNKMETSIVYGGFIGIMEKKIMENKMETTIVYSLAASRRNKNSS